MRLDEAGKETFEEERLRRRTFQSGKGTPCYGKSRMSALKPSSMEGVICLHQSMGKADFGTIDGTIAGGFDNS